MVKYNKCQRFEGFEMAASSERVVPSIFCWKDTASNLLTRYGMGALQGFSFSVNLTECRSEREWSAYHRNPGLKDLYYFREQNGAIRLLLNTPTATWSMVIPETDASITEAGPALLTQYFLGKICQEVLTEIARGKLVEGDQIPPEPESGTTCIRLNPDDQTYSLSFTDASGNRISGAIDHPDKEAAIREVQTNLSGAISAEQIVKDFLREFFMGTDAEFRVFWAALKDQNTGAWGWYTQGVWTGRVQADVLYGQYPLRPVVVPEGAPERREDGEPVFPYLEAETHYKVNRGNFSFTFVDETGAVCGFDFEYRKDNPARWVASFVHDANRPLQEQNCVVLSTQEPTPRREEYPMTDERFDYPAYRQPLSQGTLGDMHQISANAPLFRILFDRLIRPDNTVDLAVAAQWESLLVHLHTQKWDTPLPLDSAEYASNIAAALGLAMFPIPAGPASSSSVSSIEWSNIKTSDILIRLRLHAWGQNDKFDLLQGAQAEWAYLLHTERFFPILQAALGHEGVTAEQLNHLARVLAKADSVQPGMVLDFYGQNQDIPQLFALAEIIDGAFATCEDPSLQGWITANWAQIRVYYQNPEIHTPPLVKGEQDSVEFTQQLIRYMHVKMVPGAQALQPQARDVFFRALMQCPPLSVDAQKKVIEYLTSFPDTRPIDKVVLDAMVLCEERGVEVSLQILLNNKQIARLIPHFAKTETDFLRRFLGLSVAEQNFCAQGLGRLFALKDVYDYRRPLILEYLTGGASTSASSSSSSSSVPDNSRSVLFRGLLGHKPPAGFELDALHPLINKLSELKDGDNIPALTQAMHDATQREALYILSGMGFGGADLADKAPLLQTHAAQIVFWRRHGMAFRPEHLNEHSLKTLQAVQTAFSGQDQAAVSAWIATYGESMLAYAICEQSRGDFDACKSDLNPDNPISQRVVSMLRFARTTAYRPDINPEVQVLVGQFRLAIDALAPKPDLNNIKRRTGELVNLFSHPSAEDLYTLQQVMDALAVVYSVNRKARFAAPWLAQNKAIRDTILDLRQPADRALLEGFVSLGTGDRKEAAEAFQYLQTLPEENLGLDSRQTLKTLLVQGNTPQNKVLRRLLTGDARHAPLPVYLEGGGDLIGLMREISASPALDASLVDAFANEAQKAALLNLYGLGFTLEQMINAIPQVALENNRVMIQWLSERGIRIQPENLNAAFFQAIQDIVTHTPLPVGLTLSGWLTAPRIDALQIYASTNPKTQDTLNVLYLAFLPEELDDLITEADRKMYVHLLIHQAGLALPAAFPVERYQSLLDAFQILRSQVDVEEAQKLPVYNAIVTHYAQEEQPAPLEPDTLQAMVRARTLCPDLDPPLSGNDLTANNDVLATAINALDDINQCTAFLQLPAASRPMAASAIAGLTAEERETAVPALLEDTPKGAACRALLGTGVPVEVTSAAQWALFVGVRDSELTEAQQQDLAGAFGNSASKATLIQLHAKGFSVGQLIRILQQGQLEALNGVLTQANNLVVNNIPANWLCADNEHVTEAHRDAIIEHATGAQSVRYLELLGQCSSAWQLGQLNNTFAAAYPNQLAPDAVPLLYHDRKGDHLNVNVKPLLSAEDVHDVRIPEDSHFRHKIAIRRHLQDFPGDLEHRGDMITLALRDTDQARAFRRAIAWIDYGCFLIQQRADNKVARFDADGNHGEPYARARAKQTALNPAAENSEVNTYKRTMYQALYNRVTTPGRNAQSVFVNTLQGAEQAFAIPLRAENYRWARRILKVITNALSLTFGLGVTNLIERFHYKRDFLFFSGAESAKELRHLDRMVRSEMKKVAGEAPENPPADENPPNPGHGG